VEQAYNTTAFHAHAYSIGATSAVKRDTEEQSAPGDPLIMITYLLNWSSVYI
jgi:hypothetical protein